MAVGRSSGFNIDEMGTACRHGKQKNRMVWLIMYLSQRLMCLMERLFSIFYQPSRCEWTRTQWSR